MLIVVLYLILVSIPCCSIDTLCAGLCSKKNGMEPSDLKWFSEIQSGQDMISIKKYSCKIFLSPSRRLGISGYQALLTEQHCIACLANPDVSIIIALIRASTCIPHFRLSHFHLTS